MLSLKAPSINLNSCKLNLRVEMGGLHKFAQLDTTVTVIDAFNLYSNFSTADFISDRWGAIHEITPDDERTITDLLVDQIEFADVIIINKIETVGKEMLNRIKALITKLNPVAKVLTSSYSKVDVSEIVNTKKFSFEKAATGAGWLRSLHEMTMRDGFGKAGSGAKLAPKPETEE